MGVKLIKRFQDEMNKGSPGLLFKGFPGKLPAPRVEKYISP